MTDREAEIVAEIERLERAIDQDARRAEEYEDWADELHNRVTELECQAFERRRELADLRKQKEQGA